MINIVKLISKLLNRQRYIFGSFFLLVILFSAVTYRDYGVFIDDVLQTGHLRVTGKKVFSTLGLLEQAPQAVKRAKNLEEYPYKYYGTSAHFPLMLLDYFPKQISPSASTFWELRHAYVRLFFVLAGFLFFLLLRKVTDSNLLIFIGLVMFFMYPRISANSFYNIKDSLFLSLFTISTYFLFRYIDKTTTKNLIFLTISTAFTINSRMMGILIPAYFLLWAIINYKNNYIKMLKNVLFFIIFLGSTLYIIWPALWGNPVKVFTEAFSTFSNYSSVWKGGVIFDGKILKGTSKTIYVPTWILITSPFAYIYTWVLGYIFLLANIYKNRKNNLKLHLLFFSTFVTLGSYSVIVLFKSTLYGDWRHLYYIFPSMIMIGVFGLDFIRNEKTKLYQISLVFIAFSLLLTLRWMWVNYPHHYVFFNKIAGNWDVRWDRDFMRVSGKQLLEKFIESPEYDSNKKYSFNTASYIRNNIRMLPKKYRDSINLTPSLDQADYVVGDYRNVIGAYEKSAFPGFEEYISVRVDGKKIMTLFKRMD